MGKTTARLVSHTGVVSRPPRQICSLGKPNTCGLSCIFIVIVTTWFD